MSTEKLNDSEVVLAVDLDGTLICEDMTRMAFKRYLRHAWWAPMALLYHFMREGWAGCKAEVAKRIPLDTGSLTYHPKVVAWIKEARAQGRTVWLATASHQDYAVAVCSHLPLFDDYLASNDNEVYSGAKKRDALIERCGGVGRFDYIGNSRADLPVWQAARHAYVVHASAAVIHRASEISQVVAVVD